MLVDGKVRALSSLHFNLCVAVGEVHRYAGIVAAAWGSSADGFNTAGARFRNLLHCTFILCTKYLTVNFLSSLEGLFCGVLERNVTNYFLDPL